MSDWKHAEIVVLISYRPEDWDAVDAFGDAVMDHVMVSGHDKPWDVGCVSTMDKDADERAMAERNRRSELHHEKKRALFAAVILLALLIVIAIQSR